MAFMHRWWVQNVLPLVYDNSLSYYEVLAKITWYLNGLSEDVANVIKTLGTIEGIQDVEAYTQFLESIQNSIGSLQSLDTEDKNNIVSAINEVLAVANNAYVKPESGIPESDLSEDLKIKINNQSVSSYNELTDKPSINGVTLKGNVSGDKLGLGTYSKPASGIPESDLSTEVQEKLNAHGEGGSGTTNYNDLTNKPSINGVTLKGNNTADSLGLGTYSKPNSGIPMSDLSTEVQNAIAAGGGESGTKNYNDLINKPSINGQTLIGNMNLNYYTKPNSGIPESDLSNDVKEKLNAMNSIAGSLDEFVADKDYAEGDLIYINGVLYKVTTNVLEGTNLVPGENIEITDINKQLEEINAKIEELSSLGGVDGWNVNATIRRTNHSTYKFFEYFRGIGGENYLFIFTPASAENNRFCEFVIKKRDGTIAYQDGNNINPSIDTRITFTPVDTDDYYCELTPEYSSANVPVAFFDVSLEYTRSQGLTAIMARLDEVDDLPDRVEALETLTAQHTSEINALKSSKTGDSTSIEKITGSMPASWISGRYTAPSTTFIGETISYFPSDSYVCAKIPCSEGDTISLHVGGPTGTTRAWFIVDENMVCIQRALSNVTSPATVVAKAGAAYALITNQLSKMSTGYYAYKGSPTIKERVDDCEDVVYNKLLDKVEFYQGRIATTNGTDQPSNNRIRTRKIGIDNFVKCVCSSAGELTTYCYDANSNYLGYSANAKTNWNTEDVLALYSNTYTVRFTYKKTDESSVTPADCELYGIKCYITDETPSTYKPLNYDVMKNFLNENNELTSTLNYRYNIDQSDIKNKIFSIRAKYTGTDAPRFSLYGYAPDGHQEMTLSPISFIGKNEFINQEFRMPNDYSVVAYQINLTIPAGSTLIVDNCNCYDEGNIYQKENGVIVGAHRGLDCAMPGDSFDAIVAAGRCGFKYCVTIPKFTSDGVAVCFHNDGGSSSPISEQLTLENGEPIPEVTDSSHISDFTYDELMQWSIGAFKNSFFAGSKILKLEDFFMICSQYGMHPVLSVHPLLNLANWQEVKRLADRWNVSRNLSVKSGNRETTWHNVIQAFGDGNIERIISLYGATSTYDIVQHITEGRTQQGIVNTPVTVEFFDDGLTNPTYGPGQLIQLENAVAAGYHVSVYMNSGITSNQMHEYVDMGVAEFTNGRFVNMNLLW